MYLVFISITSHPPPVYAFTAAPPHLFLRCHCDYFSFRCNPPCFPPHCCSPCLSHYNWLSSLVYTAFPPASASIEPRLCRRPRIHSCLSRLGLHTSVRFHCFAAISFVWTFTLFPRVKVSTDSHPVWVYTAVPPSAPSLPSPTPPRLYISDSVLDSFPLLYLYCSHRIFLSPVYPFPRITYIFNK